MTFEAEVNWRHAISAIGEWAQSMPEEDKLRVGREQAKTLELAAQRIRFACLEREHRAAGLIAEEH